MPEVARGNPGGRTIHAQSPRQTCRRGAPTPCTSRTDVRSMWVGVSVGPGCCRATYCYKLVEPNVVFGRINPGLIAIVTRRR
jgi:hypothetical protein